MKMILILVVLMTMVSAPAFATDIDDEDSEKVVNVKSLLDIERDKHNQIKLLNMEVQRYHAELEKQKVINQLKELQNQDESFAYADESGFKDAGQTVSVNWPKLRYLFIGDSVKEAVLVFGLDSVLTREGDMFADGMYVKHIRSDSVELVLGEYTKSIKLNYLF